MTQDTVIWTDYELEAWRPPAQLTVSEWSDRNRVLTAMTSAEPGQWRTDRTPYLRGIMDAFTDPQIETITIMASTQVGKTECMFNMLAYVIDQDPGPALYVEPRIEDSRSNSQNRIKPMLEASESLRRHLPHNADAFKTLEYKLDHMNVYFAGSNSPADLASRAIRFLFFNEIDKYPRFSGKEADPIKLATERTRTFWNRKIVQNSTPTTENGYVYREYQKSDQQRYYMPCPHCGEFQYLVFSQLKFVKPEIETHVPGTGVVKQVDLERIKFEKLAWYECRRCEKRIDDNQKSDMLKKGIWAPEGAEILPGGQVKHGKRTRHRGFWINALYSPWLTFADIAAEFLRSKDHVELLMNFVNSWLAEPWKEKSEETKPHKLREKVCPYHEGVVPVEAMVLTAGVDVQKDHFYFVIRGWGANERSWLIRAARVETWEEVIHYLFLTDYMKEDQSDRLSVRLTCIDAQYRTDEVHDVCRQRKGITRAIMGHDHLNGQPYRVTKIDRHTQSGDPAKRGLQLWHIDTTFFKDKINRIVHADPDYPAQWYLYDCPPDSYFEQFCAEVKVLEVDRKTGKTSELWKLKQTGAANHYLDCEVYAIAAANMLKVHLLRDTTNRRVHRPEHKHESNLWEGSYW